jgi:hypothetical protein
MKRAFVFAVVLLFVASGCKRHLPREGGLTPVTITIKEVNGEIQVAKETVIYQDSQEAVWETADHDEFVVYFKAEPTGDKSKPDTPFKKRYFHERHNHSGKSQFHVPDEQKDGVRFRYGVLYHGKTVDPDVIIKPGNG